MGEPKEYSIKDQSFVQIDVLELRDHSVACRLNTGVGECDISMDLQSYYTLLDKGFFTTTKKNESSNAVMSSDEYRIPNPSLID